MLSCHIANAEGDFVHLVYVSSMYSSSKRHAMLFFDPKL